jgi:hypothetical protein
VRWVVESDGILVVDGRASRSLKLGQRESALWQMVLAGISFPELCNFFKLLDCRFRPQAVKFIESNLKKWKSAGLLTNG